MRRYCLDTSGYSNFRRGHDPVVKLVREAEWVGIPWVVLGELWAGFLNGRRVEENQRKLIEFLAHPVVRELPADREVAMVYGEIVDALRQAGTPLPTNDIWIAAAAASVGATVVTYDEHFRAIDRVSTMILEAPMRPQAKSEPHEQPD